MGPGRVDQVVGLHGPDRVDQVVGLHGPGRVDQVVGHIWSNVVGQQHPQDTEKHQRLFSKFRFEMQNINQNP